MGTPEPPHNAIATAKGHRPMDRRVVITAACLILVAAVVYGIRIYQSSQGVDLTVYLRSDITAAQQASVVGYLRALDTIGDVDLQTSQEAAREFAASHPGATGPSPAPLADLRVTLARPQTLPVVRTHLTALPGVASVAP